MQECGIGKGIVPNRTSRIGHAKSQAAQKTNDHTETGQYHDRN